MKTSFLTAIMAIFLFIQLGVGQQGIIQITNPSFEAITNSSPTGWDICAKSNRNNPNNENTTSNPDIQPGKFNVSLPASNGEKYIGLVIRDNDTHESIGQKLKTPLKANNCYSFSIHMCLSKNYRNRSTKYSKPAALKVYGANSKCDKRTLLTESSTIENTEWDRFDFSFEAKETFNYIFLEAYYNNKAIFPYNGNILLDDMSNIEFAPCES